MPPAPLIPTTLVSTPPPLPSRPAELPLAGLDPCKILYVPSAEMSLDAGQNTANGCEYKVSTGALLRLTLDTRQALSEVATSDTQARNISVQNRGTGATAPKVHGRELTTPGMPLGKAHCVLMLDVSAGNTLIVEYRESSTKPESPSFLCKQATRVAEYAVQGVQFAVSFPGLGN